MFAAGALGYALSVKNIFVMNVEYYTGVDERLPMPVVLPPIPELVDLEPRPGAGGRRRGRHRAHAGPGARLLPGQGGRRPGRRAVPEAPLGDRLPVRLVPDRPVDLVPLVLGAAGGGRPGGPTGRHAVSPTPVR